MSATTRLANRRNSVQLAGAILLAMSWGCGGPTDIPGGTPGRIHIDGLPLREVQVTLYETIGPEAKPLAFGISDSEGQFQLRKQGTLEGVWLSPGTYRATLESVGEIYMRWPEAYRQPDLSPLEIEWSDESETLDLNVPEPKVPRG